MVKRWSVVLLLLFLLPVPVLAAEEQWPGVEELYRAAEDCGVSTRGDGI